MFLTRKCFVYDLYTLLEAETEGIRIFESTGCDLGFGHLQIKTEGTLNDFFFFIASLRLTTKRHDRSQAA